MSEDQLKPLSYPMNSSGLHKLRCPSCGGDRILSQLSHASPEYDRNLKGCEDCSYRWQQTRPRETN